MSLFKALLQGKWLGHPLHPALVHLPTGLFPAALLFDVIGRLDCQTLISVTERDIVPAQPARRDFLVRAGSVVENP